MLIDAATMATKHHVKITDVAEHVLATIGTGKVAGRDRHA